MARKIRAYNANKDTRVINLKVGSKKNNMALAREIKSLENGKESLKSLAELGQDALIERYQSALDAKAQALLAAEKAVGMHASRAERDIVDKAMLDAEMFEKYKVLGGSSQIDEYLRGIREERYEVGKWQILDVDMSATAKDGREDVAYMIDEYGRISIAKAIYDAKAKKWVFKLQSEYIY